MVDEANVHRRYLKASIGALCLEKGFDAVTRQAIETLTEMVQSCKKNFKVFFMFLISVCIYNFIYMQHHLITVCIYPFNLDLSEVGRSSLAICELAGRSKPTLNDVQLALVEMGWLNYQNKYLLYIHVYIILCSFIKCKFCIHVCYTGCDWSAGYANMVVYISKIFSLIL